MKIKFLFVGILLILAISKILSFDKQIQQSLMKPSIQEQQVLVNNQKNSTAKSLTQSNKEQVALITKQHTNKKRIIQEETDNFLNSNDDGDDDEEDELDLNKNEMKLTDFNEDSQNQQNIQNAKNNLVSNTSSLSSSSQSSRKQRSKTAKIIGLLFLSGLFIGFGFFLYNLYTCTKKKEPTLEYEEEMEDTNILQINNKSDDNLKQ